SIGAAFFPTALPIQFQSSFSRTGCSAVALVTVVCKDRANLAFKEIQLALGNGLRRRALGLRQCRNHERQGTRDDDCNRSKNRLDVYAVRESGFRFHASIPFTTSPKLSVSRKSRPL